MNTPSVSILALVVGLTGFAWSGEAPSIDSASVVHTAKLKVRVTEENFAVSAQNVHFEALVTGVFGALGMLEKDTILEFEPGIADQIVSMRYEGIRNGCIIFPALARAGHCQIRDTNRGHFWTFKHEGTQQVGTTGAIQPSHPSTSQPHSANATSR